jgi:hypothetical protein
MIGNAGKVEFGYLPFVGERVGVRRLNGGYLVNPFVEIA